MNIWLTLALALLAFFFIQENQVFFAFLCIVGIIFFLATEKPRPQTTVVRGPNGQPYVVQQQAGKFPKRIKVRIQKNWKARSMWEEFGIMIGPILDTVGRTGYRLFSGESSEKDWGQQKDERLRGR